MRGLEGAKLKLSRYLCRTLILSSDRSLPFMSSLCNTCRRRYVEPKLYSTVVVPLDEPLARAPSDPRLSILSLFFC